METFMIVLKVFCGLVCIIFAICMIFGNAETKKTATIATVLVLAVIIGVMDGEQRAISRNEEIDKAKTLINNGGEMYLDGQKASPEGIILENYNIEFKGGNVILSEKRKFLGVSL